MRLPSESNNSKGVMMGSFDKIASKVKPADKKPSAKPQADLTDNVRKAVDAIVQNKAAMAALKAELADNENTVIDHVLPQYFELARKGQFTKSLELLGDKSRLLFSTADSFSVPQDEETLNQVKELLNERYNEFLTTHRSISIKEDVLKNESTLEKIAKACEKAGLPIGDIFDVTDKVEAVSGLDEKQFELDEDKFEMFRILIKQRKPALK